jgi:hypothetical protein
VEAMGTSESLTNRSDIYILAELKAAVDRGDTCTAHRMADELRRRLQKLRMQEMMYHVDTYLDNPASACP